MRIEKIIILLMLSLIVVSCQGQSGKKTAEDVLKENNVTRAGKYESKDGGFKINFPCEPLKNELPTESDYGNKTVTTNECGNEIARYSVSYEDFTKPVGDAKKFFKSRQKMRFEGMEDSVKVILETEKKIGNYPAVYYETEQKANEFFPKSGLYNELNVLKEKRYYAIWTTVLGRDGQSPKDIKQEIRDKTKEFIDSFELIESK